MRTTVAIAMTLAVLCISGPALADKESDCQKGVDRWNRTLAAVGRQLTLPHLGFNRQVGAGHALVYDVALRDPSALQDPFTGGVHHFF